MNRFIVLAALLTPAVLAPAALADEQFIDWQTDYHQALAMAKAANKPLFLEFRCEA